MLQRPQFLDRLPGSEWDVLIVGGGATGIGAALDAASRGYRTLLLERQDFSGATSSRSTKLIHGGVRYLAQGNLSLVRESLHERGLLLKHAPALVKPLEFLVPTHSLWETAYYATGLKAYDALAGGNRLKWSAALSQRAALQRVPTLAAGKLWGGVSYYDAQFDDARLALAAASTAARLGATVLNYFTVNGFLKTDGRVRGVVATDSETGREYELSAKVVINATGIYTDDLRRVDDPTSKPLLQLSQGVHIVLDRSFLPGETAIIVPSTEDGRVLFLIPWQGATLVGTTDIPATRAEQEPRPTREEIEYLLEYFGKYVTRNPTRHDVRSCFAGLRPLVKAADVQATSQISREHIIQVSPSGVVSVAGGKWTTFRKMGADVVSAAVRSARLTAAPSTTSELVLTPEAGYAELFSPQTPPPAPTEELVRHFVHSEMARTLDDVLSRRTRWLMIDAREAVRLAPGVAQMLSRELGRDAQWAEAETARFRALAAGYLPGTW